VTALWSLPLLPVVAATVMLVVRRHERAVTAIGLAAIGVVLAGGVWAAWRTPAASWRWGAGLELGLAVAGFGRVMVVLVPFVALIVLLSAAATEREGRTRLLAGLVAFVGAMQLLVTAGDLLTLLVAWELVGATSWVLVGHGWRQVDNVRAAAQAFVTTRFGDLGLYLAAGITFASVGSFEFAAVPQVDADRLPLVAGGILLAAAAKSAQLPFAPWLFSAMAGPTPASALLHSATMVSAGAYLLIRLAPSFEAVAWFAPTVAAIGLATALAGGAVALTQRHLKRALAGSTSAQYGLMFLAVGAGSTAAAGAQLVAHALFKALLFLAAGAAIHTAGTADLERMRLGRRLPVVAMSAAVGALALAAVPPLGGSWTKEQILAVTIDRSMGLGGATLVAALLTAAYAARLWVLAFGPGPPGNGPAAAGDRRPVVALVTLATTSVLLGLLWLPAGAELVEAATGGLLAHGALGGLVAAWGAIVVAVIAVWWLHRRGRLVDLGLPPRLQAAVTGWFGLPGAARRVVVDPVLRLSQLLAIADDRLVDAGVRGAVALAQGVSRALDRFAELSFTALAHGAAGAALAAGRWLRRRIEPATDAVVGGIAAGTDLLALASRRTDDRGIDQAVEGLARATAAAGHRARQSQTGLTHHYYLYAAVGAAMLVLSLVVFR
jgi:NADH:ubiquinone oxidoreductase subunit 5 (subunit L)/multisubunit Na+/H+ antiporter MnhA subunit